MSEEQNTEECEECIVDEVSCSQSSLRDELHNHMGVDRKQSGDGDHCRGWRCRQQWSGNIWTKWGNNSWHPPLSRIPPIHSFWRSHLLAHGSLFCQNRSIHPLSILSLKSIIWLVRPQPQPMKLLRKISIDRKILNIPILLCSRC